jgi:quercetin dioxygenase-like cupin family protein
MPTATGQLDSAASERVETITHEGTTLCIIVRAHPEPTATTFYTPNDFNLQCGNIVYPAGSEIPRHTHRRVSRTIHNTSEVLVVQKGRMVVDLYSGDREFVCSREMATGDVVVLMAGGHGFRLLDDTILLEVKQGPYGGLQEKDRF